MDIRTPSDVRFICNILFDGFRESYSPTESLIEVTDGRILNFLELLHKKGYQDEICYYEKESHTLWTYGAWQAKVRTKEKISEELRELHTENKRVLARRSLVAAAIRRALNSTHSDKLADLLAIKIIKENNIGMLVGMEIDPSILTEEIDNPDDYL